MQTEASTTSATTSNDVALNRYPLRATLPAADLGRAKRFYSETLGLRAISESPDGIVYEAGVEDQDSRPGWARTGTFLVFPTPITERGGHTQMGFLVDDVERTVAALRARGVHFEEYDRPGFQTSDGVAVIGGGRGKGAWFKDSEGNLIGLVHFD